MFAFSEMGIRASKMHGSNITADGRTRGLSLEFTSIMRVVPLEMSKGMDPKSDLFFKMIDYDGRNARLN